MTNFYLLDHPNPNGNHFYTSRRGKIKGQIIHITASIEDIDLVGPDRTCEAEAKYAATTSRQVSWHTGSDTDGYLNLLPYGYTAFQCINYNSTTAGHEISKTETDWRDDDEDVIERRLFWAAEAIRGPMKFAGIPFRKATKQELDHAIATNGPPVGMVGHTELDPTRRSDPGMVRGVDTFPWARFINVLKSVAPPTIPDIIKETDMFILRADGKPLVLVIGNKISNISNADRSALLGEKVPEYNFTAHPDVYDTVLATALD